MKTQPKRILFTGGSGLLGEYFLKDIRKGFFVLATYLNHKPTIDRPVNYKFTKLNITDKSAVSRLMAKFQPEIVIHAAAIGDVDFCEQNKKLTRKVNVDGTRYVAASCLKNPAKIIFISSNAVYDGKNPPYSEKDERNPLHYYGISKLQAENEIKNTVPSYVIVRLMTMYGWNAWGTRLNPVIWLIEKLSSGCQLNMATDVYNNHLYARQAAHAIWRMIENNIDCEEYNIAGQDPLNRYEQALMVAEVFGLDRSLISPVTSNFFKTLIPRPMNTTFDICKMKKKLGIQPIGMLEGLRAMIEEKIL